MNVRKTLVALLLATLAAGAQPLLPDPEQCLSSPGMERLAGSLFAQRFEKGLGGARPEILPSDHPDTRLVQKVTDRLAKVVAFDRPHMRLQAKVVVEKEPNAFCIPAGYIYVHTGMLEYLRRIDKDKNIEDELAGVLGHEIAHAVLRHTIQSWRDLKDYKAVLDDPMVFQKTILAMSRAQETEADRYGAHYALRAGYQLTPMIAVYQNFPEVPARYRKESDHPSNAERVKQLKKYAAQLQMLMGLWDEALKSAATDQWLEARTVLEILAAEFPNLASVHNNLGWVYYRIYESQADPRPDFRVSPCYSKQLGLTLRGGGGELEVHPMLRQAEDEFLLAHQCDPDQEEASAGLATCYLLQNRLTEGHALLSAYAEPRQAALWNLKGLLAQKAGQASQAGEFFARALQLEPGYLPALFNAGKYQEALALEPTGYWADQARKRSGLSLQSPAPAARQEVLGLRLGMSQQEVASKLGPPAQEQLLESQTRRQWFPKQGLELWVGRDGLATIRWEPRQGDPTLGLKAGDSEQNIVARLGQPQRRSADDRGTAYWHYPSRGFTLELDPEQRLRALLVGQP